MALQAVADFGLVIRGQRDHDMVKSQSVERLPSAGEPTTVLPFAPDGKTGHALIVHSPGNNNLEILLRGALADCLISRGWQVDISTLIPSHLTVSTEYDFVVLGAPVHDGHAARLLLDYADHAQGLGGKPVFLVLVGAAISAEAMAELRNHAAAAGCNILEAIELDVDTTEQTPQKMYELEDVMRRAAERLAFVRRPIAARTY